jgi:SET domain-containing protein
MVALKAFKPGELICEIKGRIVTPKTLWRYWESDPRRSANCFRFSPERYLDPHGEIGAYANHACYPNSGIVKQGRRLLLKAITAIARGEEVTHDYSTLLAADDVWTMHCNCGATSCRRVVGHIGRLPAAVLARYKQLGIIPAFMLASH